MPMGREHPAYGDTGESAHHLHFPKHTILSRATLTFFMSAWQPGHLTRALNHAERLLR